MEDFLKDPFEDNRCYEEPQIWPEDPLKWGLDNLNWKENSDKWPEDQTSWQPNAQPVPTNNQDWSDQPKWLDSQWLGSQDVYQQQNTTRGRLTDSFAQDQGYSDSYTQRQNPGPAQTSRTQNQNINSTGVAYGQMQNRSQQQNQAFDLGDAGADQFGLDGSLNAAPANDFASSDLINMVDPKTVVMSPQQDPFLQTFDFLGSPTQTAVSPQAVPFGDSSIRADANAFPDAFSLNVSGLYNTLDQIVSPTNDAMFASSQYFSPNNRSNFGALNSIVENSASPSVYANTFSPNISRHGSVSLAPPLAASSYLLSPKSYTYEGLFDTLKSLYLNNPRSNTLGMLPGDSLSPPARNSYGPSSYLGSKTPVSVAKNLSQEEKAKRRREFHNAVERRRRDLIKEKIKELSSLVPPSLLSPQVSALLALLEQFSQNSKEKKELLTSIKVKEAKPNKALILQVSVEYIKHLKYVSEKQLSRRAELEAEIAELELCLGSLLLNFNPDDFFTETPR